MIFNNFNKLNKEDIIKLIYSYGPCNCIADEKYIFMDKFGTCIQVPKEFIYSEDITDVCFDDNTSVLHESIKLDSDNNLKAVTLVPNYSYINSKNRIILEFKDNKISKILLINPKLKVFEEVPKCRYQIKYHNNGNDIKSICIKGNVLNIKIIFDILGNLIYLFTPNVIVKCNYNKYNIVTSWKVYYKNTESDYIEREVYEFKTKYRKEILKI